MLPKQKYAVYNQRNVSSVLIQAQQHKNLVEAITTMKKTVDQSGPQKFTHLKGIGTKADLNRKRDVDHQNQKLLGKIMQIMKRKNKSVQHARATPAQVVGGHDSLMNRYGLDFAGNSIQKQGLDQSQRRIESMMGNSGLDDSIMRGNDNTSKRSASTAMKIKQKMQDQQHEQMMQNDEILAASPFDNQFENEDGRQQQVSFAVNTQMDHQPHNQMNTIGEMNGVNGISEGSQGNDQHITGYGTISGGLDDGEEKMMMSKRVGSQNQNLRRIGESTIQINSNNPFMMRGSLNCGFRKNEMIRINQGNKKILEQLRQVKPGVGTIEAWRKHENRSQSRKRIVAGMKISGYLRNTGQYSQTIGSRGNSFSYMGADNFSIDPTQLTPDLQRPPMGKFQLPKLSAQENAKIYCNESAKIQLRNNKLFSPDQRFSETAQPSTKRSVKMNKQISSDHAVLQMMQRQGSLDQRQRTNTMKYQRAQNFTEQKGINEISREQSRENVNDSSRKNSLGRFKSPIMSLNKYPNHILKRIIKDPNSMQQFDINQSNTKKYIVIDRDHRIGNDPMIQNSQHEQDKIWVQAQHSLHDQDQLQDNNFQTNQLNIMSPTEQQDSLNDVAPGNQENSEFTTQPTPIAEEKTKDTKTDYSDINQTDIQSISNQESTRAAQSKLNTNPMKINEQALAQTIPTKVLSTKIQDVTNNKYQSQENLNKLNDKDKSQQDKVSNDYSQTAGTQQQQFSQKVNKDQQPQSVTQKSTQANQKSEQITKVVFDTQSGKTQGVSVASPSPQKVSQIIEEDKSNKQKVDIQTQKSPASQPSQKK